MLRQTITLEQQNNGNNNNITEVTTAIFVVPVYHPCYLWMKAKGNDRYTNVTCDSIHTLALRWALYITAITQWYKQSQYQRIVLIICYYIRIYTVNVSMRYSETTPLEWINTYRDSKTTLYNAYQRINVIWGIYPYMCTCSTISTQSYDVFGLQGFENQSMKKR